MTAAAPSDRKPPASRRGISPPTDRREATLERHAGAAGAFRSGTIALVGRPNVGKSTLINRLVGEKVAIVSDVPQTTRTRVVGVRRVPGAELIFVDTPGLHKPRHLLNEAMVRAARAALDEADVILFLVDVSAPLGPGDRAVLDLLRSRRAPVLLILNKVDRVEKPRVLPMIDESRTLFAFAEIFPISAARDDDFADLVKAIVALLPVDEAAYPEDEYTDQPLRALAAEWIREPILRHTRQEVPHAVAVRIDEFIEDDEKGLVTIKATVVVEKASQKGILIGSGGAMMKRVGEEARIELERVTGRKVFLSLWVTVEEAWRQSPRALRELGYT